MVTILPPATNVGTQIGQGFQQGLQSALEFAAQQQRLGKTVEQIKRDNPNIASNPYLSQVLGLSPLLNVPGGSQLLGEVAPLLAQQGQNQAQIEAIRRAREGRGGTAMGGPGGPGGLSPQPVGQPQTQPGGAQQPAAAGQTGNRFLSPQVASSPLTTFPEVTAGPTTQPEMSPAQLQDYALTLMEESAKFGKPMSLADGLAQGNALNQQIRASNEVIRSEKTQREAAQRALTDDMVARAQNSGLIDAEKFPEGRTIAGKLALEQAGAANKEQAWENLRTNLRKVENARHSLSRNYTQPSLVGAATRKITGTFKEKEQALKDMQPNLDIYREHGLYDEARDLLVNTVGLGPEDTERALFPPSKEETKILGAFPTNPSPTKKGEHIPLSQLEFPGEIARLNPDNFRSFKERVFDYIKQHPNANLINLRGRLNQDKRYSWQDINQALSELVDERRFSPNIEQDKEFNVIREAPIQGLGKWFDFLWKGTK